MTRIVAVVGALLVSVPAFGQVDLSGTYEQILHEDYIERGPGSDLGDFTAAPLNDAARALALMYTSDTQSMIERQCLHWSPWVLNYRPEDLPIWNEADRDGRVIVWKIGGEHIQDTIEIWMDGRPEPSENAWYPSSGFTTGKWEGDTLTTRTTHLKQTYLRRGTGIPSSDQQVITSHITRHDDLLTIVTIVEDPVYLTEPHVVSRVWRLDPHAPIGRRAVCDTGTEVPRLEDSGIVPHYMPGKNPEADFMTRTYNVPMEAAMGYAETLYPEYRKKLKSVYKPPMSCGRYCCGWIEAQGRPGGAPNLTCNDGGFEDLGPRGRRQVGDQRSQPSTSK